MTIPLAMKRGVVAILLMIAFVLQGTTSVLAGTTGSINGTVVDASTNQPIAGAKVTAASPSQTATTTSDASGRYSFVSLTPDTYTVSVPAAGSHDAFSVSGVTVQADQSITVTVAQPQKLKVIGSVTSRSSGALVKPGTTADVYSINAATQDKASNLGGGALLNSAWSAISSVPGVYVAPGGAGYVGAGPGVSIRGGDYDQIGYELDGIPVNRSFDNYPSSQLSALGQQELQVYTGATPANSEASGLSGYVNQVIRTGTAPAYRSLDLAVGSPTLYNKLAFETGGANPSRTFSYYFGAGGYNQDYRYGDQFNGAGISNTWGTPLGLCPADATPATFPSCFAKNGTPYTNNGVVNAYALGPYNFGNLSRNEDRDTVLNLHVGIPTKAGNKDDVQLLWDNSHLHNEYYSSTNDQGGLATVSDVLGFNPNWTDAYQFNGAPRGALLPVNYAGGGATTYLYPDSPTGRAFNGDLPPNQRDSFDNDQGVVKAQYQHNFGTNAFLRVYGYTYYSDWLNLGPQCLLANFACGASPDYELSSHTHGASLQFSDQLNSQHLLSVNASFTAANSLRDNNTQMINGFYGPNSLNFRTVVGVLVNPTNYLQTGQCYTLTGTAVNCYNGSGSSLNQALKGNGAFTLQQAYNGTVPSAAGAMCGGAQCQYLVIGNGLYATYNTVKPKFTAVSITDNWKPTDKLTVNYGLRLDRYEFDGSDTTNSAARQFLFQAYNTQVVPHNAGYVPLYNTPSQVMAYNVFQPRIGATFTVNPSTVLRASYGRYAQAPNSAFEQYDYLQPNSPTSLEPFAKNGIGNTPGHRILPPTSNNYDFSVEHQFSRDLSVKVSPFLRKTQNQIEQFFLDQKTNFVSGANVGNQTSEGVEFELDKGDFARNGLAARLAFTYTNSYIRYSRGPNGASVADSINTQIAQFNGFTKAGGGVPCYDASGNPIPSTSGCVAGTTANPYYNMAPQGLLDPNGNYAPFDSFPGAIGSAYTAYGAPYVATLVTQYKHDKFAISPALQFSAGQRYGVPATTPGVDPSTCTALPTGSAANDPRYPNGGYGSPYDATTCGGTLTIPDPYTGKFDGIGAFVEPSQLQLHIQASYEVNNRLTLVGNFANVYTACFGGSKVPFAVSGACSYGAPYITAGGFSPTGNVYNPGDVIQPVANTPYGPGFKGFPFNMYLEARIKI